VRNFTAVKVGSSGTGDYAEYLLKKEALKKSSEYYTDDEQEATTSVYVGSKSAKLGLSGEIDLESAKELLAGVLPDGTQIRGDKTSGQEILAHDNTLSAPKSVSIQAAEDIRVFDCHVAAVRLTITALEKYYCVQRVQKDGIRGLEKGDGFVGWMTHHWQSREGDIDMHTHVVTMNGCMGPDGKWRAVEDHQMSKALWLGSYYRNCLGQQLQNVGYKIREKRLEGKGYSFELEGYTDQDIEAFSSRHEQISNAKKKGLGDQEAWYSTRKDKDDEISLGELFEKTITQKAEIGCTGQSFPMGMNLQPIGKTDATAIVDRAIAHLSRGSCRFSQGELLAECFDHIEQVRLKEVEGAIAVHPELVDYGVIRGIDHLKGEYTTASALERETRIIQRWKRGQGKATPIMDKATSKEEIARLETLYEQEWELAHDLKLNDLRARIEGGDKSKKTAKQLVRPEKQEFQGLNKGQLGAVQGVLATDNNNAIIYGLSGVGKTKSLKPLKDILDEQSVETLWLAPSLSAVDVLTSDVGEQAYTLQRLAYTDSIRVRSGQIVFVDEAGLADAECIDLVGAKVEAAGARLILVGDHKQNKPIQAGSPMRSLMTHEAEVFKIWEIQRQKDPIQKQAVELIANGKGVESIELLNEYGYVTEIQDPELRRDAIAAQYLSMPVSDRQNTLVITGTNAERLELTEKIRQGLKEDGFLGESVDCVQLEDSRLSPEQLTDLRNYEIGDYVAPIRDYVQAKRHEHCCVVGKTDDRLILAKPSGETFELNPNRWDKKKYTACIINVAIGDELRFRGKISEKDFENGQIYTVRGFAGAIATLEGKKGKIRTIDLSRPAPIDHNIVRTTYDVQGSGKDGAILSLTDDQTSNQGSTYVGISRQFECLTVYTQNYDSLLKRVSRECSHYNALDLLEEYNVNRTTANVPNRGTTADWRAEPVRPDREWDRPIAWKSTGRSEELDQDTRGQERHLFDDGISYELDGGGLQGSASDSYKTGLSDRIIGALGDRQWLGDQFRRVREETEIAEPLARLESGLSRLLELRQAVAEKQSRVDQLLALLGGVNQRRLDDVLEMPLARMQEDLMAHPEDFDSIQRSSRVDVISGVIASWRSMHSDDPTVKAETAIAYALEKMENAIGPELRMQADLKVHPEDFANIQRLDLVDVLENAIDPGEPKPFWVPDYSQAVRPKGFTKKYWKEVTDSAINPRLVEANMRPASGTWVTKRLAQTVLENPSVSNYAKDNLKAKYTPVVKGGIWFGGGYDIAALATAEAGDLIPQTHWGVYKSFTPRLDEDKTERKGEPSYRKYENPIGQPREFFMPIVPPDMADSIYAKHGINPTEAERESGLYFVALKYNLPIVLTEGAKKTMASLSQGHITIGMQGVNGLYRARDNEGNRLPVRVFNESFACWATPGRQITFAFDADSKETSIVAVRRALVHSVELLQQRGCDVKVATWLPEQGKGLDDLIVKSGPSTYEKALKTSQPPDAAIVAHYTWEYERIAAKFTNPTDGAVYAEMVATNPQDAERVLKQSDRSRALKDPEMVQRYIEEVKNELEPDPLILEFAHRILEEDGVATASGGRYFVGSNWTLHSRDGDLTIRRKDGELAYRVKGGVVKNNADERILHQICFDASNSEERRWSLRR
jgi:conjugative relaxase-like TrwC/TraI family protein